MLCQWRADQLFAEAEGEVPLSTQAYKWEPAESCLDSRSTNIPSH